MKGRPDPWSFGVLSVPEAYPEDFVSPVQFFSNHRTWSPEQRLNVALLCNAFDAWRHLERKDGVYQRNEITEWMNGGDSPIPFDDLCVALHLDPAAVRARWFRNEVQRRAPHPGGRHPQPTKYRKLQVA